MSDGLARPAAIKEKLGVSENTVRKPALIYLKENI
jgi:DNA-binding CsgD family transcriptional regulator